MLSNYLIISIVALSLMELIGLYFINKKIFVLIESILIIYIVVLFSISLNSVVLDALFIYFNLYRILNIFRGFKNREQKKLIKTSVLKSSLRINILILLITFVSVNNYTSTISLKFFSELLIIFSLLVIMLINLEAFLNIKKAKHIHKPIHYYDRDLPTVSVLIPARNETVDLEECLTSLLMSDYPKLEIIVLDDCSVTKHTSEIIKKFAHDGVRFIAGEAPSNDWLAKNFAYQQLLDQSNGELILFCGVDVRFSTHTIRSMVEIFKTEKYAMLSVVPKNNYAKDLSFASLIYQPLRYAFELTLPRYSLKRPPILSTFWIIEHDFIDKLGGFKAVKRQVTPESYFSRQVLLSQKLYRLLKTDAAIDLVSHKTPDEQKQTAIRTYYPKLHRRLDLVSLISLIEFIVFVLPAIILIYAIVTSSILLIYLAFIDVLLLILYYHQLIRITFDKTIIRYRLLVVFAALFDIYIYNLSMIKYEFGSVYWKERNICIPVIYNYN